MIGNFQRITSAKLPTLNTMEVYYDEIEQAIQDNNN